MMHTISVLVENSPGVLSKVSGLFSRRAFNIHSLAVGTTEDPDISRMTILVDGSDYTVEQISKQLNKVIPVIKVKVLREGTFLDRMLTLFKVAAPAAKRDELFRIAEMAGARIADVTKDTIIFEVTDTAEKTVVFENLMRPFGIREVVRTGSVAIEKGDVVTRKPING